MLTVTPAALDRLSGKLIGRRALSSDGLRFTRQPDGWKLHLDSFRPSDTVFDHNGRTVLLLDATTSVAMSNMSLVVKKTDDGPRLRLVKPSAR